MKPLKFAYICLSRHSIWTWTWIIVLASVWNFSNLLTFALPFLLPALQNALEGRSLSKQSTQNSLNVQSENRSLLGLLVELRMCGSIWQLKHQQNGINAWICRYSEFLEQEAVDAGKERWCQSKENSKWLSALAIQVQLVMTTSVSFHSRGPQPAHSRGKRSSSFGTSALTIWYVQTLACTGSC